MTKDGIRLHYEEYGAGKKVILSAQAGLFYPRGMQRALAERGYDVTFGARPLKRVIQREIENPLAIRLLKRGPAPEEGETITLDADEDGFLFEP